MTQKNTTTNTHDRLDGLRTLEIAAALFWITELLAGRLRNRTQTVSTIGIRSLQEQEIVGTSQILLVMYPLAIELALKSLWDNLHSHGKYPHTHDLAKLFASLPNGADSKTDAEKAQNQARTFWNRLHAEETISGDNGTLDEFLAAHAKDFADVRYYKLGSVQKVELDHLKACLLCIVAPLASRDAETFGNFSNISEGILRRLR